MLLLSAPEDFGDALAPLPAAVRVSRRLPSTRNQADVAVREVGLRRGLADNKVGAVTEVWSGMRFVVRLADRPSAP